MKGRNIIISSGLVIIVVIAVMLQVSYKNERAMFDSCYKQAPRGAENEAKIRTKEYRNKHGRVYRQIYVRVSSKNEVLFQSRKHNTYDGYYCDWEPWRAYGGTEEETRKAKQMIREFVEH